jgi:hypothetical protein
LQDYGLGMLEKLSCPNVFFLVSDWMYLYT